jgi:hypothetical protein
MRWLAPLLLISLSACGELDPNIGEERETIADLCEVGDSDPNTDVSWVEIRDTVFRGRCGCHTNTGGLGQTVGGLNLDDRQAALAGGFRSVETAIVPGDPCGSFVVQKTGPNPPFGGRMPLNGATLEPGLRQLIIDWIAEGANP